MGNKRTKKSISLEGFVFLAIFLGIFGGMGMKMGGVNMLNTLMNTGYQLLIATNIGLVVYNPRTFKTEVINVQSPSQPMAEVKNIYTDDYGMV